MRVWGKNISLGKCEKIKIVKDTDRRDVNNLKGIKYGQSVTEGDVWGEIVK